MARSKLGLRLEMEVVIELLDETLEEERLPTRSSPVSTIRPTDKGTRMKKTTKSPSANTARK
jgi:hypothetical protein